MSNNKNTVQTCSQVLSEELAVASRLHITLYKHVEPSRLLMISTVLETQTDYILSETDRI